MLFIYRWVLCKGEWLLVESVERLKIAMLLKYRWYIICIVDSAVSLWMGHRWHMVNANVKFKGEHSSLIVPKSMYFRKYENSLHLPLPTMRNMVAKSI